ncbi:MAG: hypothetical protein IPN59_08085 [Holophaga sp.]|nr:hypothetical protein [Holophaga sp.]
MKRFIAIVFGCTLAVIPMCAQTPGAINGVFTIGAATPLGAWADQVNGSLQVGVGGRYHFEGVALGAELLFTRGNSKSQTALAKDGDLSSVGLVPQVFIPLFATDNWQIFGMGGYGMARVWATRGYRTDLIPTTEGPQVETYDGSTIWQTTRPMAMVGVGWTRRTGKRLGLEVRWQRVATPGVRVTTLATCLSVAW